MQVNKKIATMAVFVAVLIIVSFLIFDSKSNELTGNISIEHISNTNQSDNNTYIAGAYGYERSYSHNIGGLDTSFISYNQATSLVGAPLKYSNYSVLINNNATELQQLLPFNSKYEVNETWEVDYATNDTFNSTGLSQLTWNTPLAKLLYSFELGNATENYQILNATLEGMTYSYSRGKPSMGGYWVALVGYKGNEVIVINGYINEAEPYNVTPDSFALVATSDMFG